MSDQQLANIFVIAAIASVAIVNLLYWSRSPEERAEMKRFDDENP